VDDGQTASFSVTATGSGPIAFQWQRGGQPIAGATSFSFSIPATTIADNGSQFSVVATNSVGSVTSSVATLNVRALAPTITGLSQATFVLVGEAATFTVAATGSAPLQFQWRRNGVAIGGATSASFVLSAATLADSGATFAVVVSNAGGTVTSVGIPLTVTAATVAPSIVVQPQDTSVLSGGAATFTVTADGTVPLSFQWRRNGTPIVGATNATLNLSSLALADDGAAFTVVVTNAAGQATSAAATLHVQAAAGIALLAGGLGGAGNIDGTASGARFNGPQGAAFDAAGNIYITDTENHTVRRITAAGVVTTFAGRAGLPGSADGPASQAQFNRPTSIASDGANIFVADASNFTIRKITPTGDVSTLAGAVGQPGYVDATGNAARFSEIGGIALDSAGNVYVGHSDGFGNVTVRKVTQKRDVTTLAGSAAAIGSLGLDGTGTAATFTGISSMAADSAGDLYVGDGTRIRKVTTAGGEVTTVAGSGIASTLDGVALAAQFRSVLGLAFDASGNLYIADGGSSGESEVRVLTPSRLVGTIAGNGPAGSADGLGSAARFRTLRGLAVDASGDVIGADSGNHTIRKIKNTGNVSTFAGAAPKAPDFVDAIGSAARFQRPVAIDGDGSGVLYVVDRFEFLTGLVRVVLPNGQVGRLPGIVTNFGFVPTSVAVDEAGTTVYMTEGCTITKLSASGFAAVTPAMLNFLCDYVDGPPTVAKFKTPNGIARAASGDLFIADTGNQVVRHVTPALDTTTIAGGPGQAGFANGTGGAARFNAPEGIAVDEAGVLYVADTQNHVIRKITPLGVVSTLAGTPGQRGFVDANAGAAKFDSPHSLAVDALGNNVYVADSGNRAIRRISASGDVTTIAGTPGAIGVATGPLPGALSNPQGITLVSQGAGLTVLGVTDVGENVVLIITVP